MLAKRYLFFIIGFCCVAAFVVAILPYLSTERSLDLSTETPSAKTAVLPKSRVWMSDETHVFVSPGEPTQVIFPAIVKEVFKQKRSTLLLDKQKNNLTVYTTPEKPSSWGERILVHLDDGRSYEIRVFAATLEHPRNASVNIADEQFPQPVDGLMNAMIRVAELNMRRGIRGYRDSRGYAGQIILKDDAIQAKIHKLFQGKSLSGYIIEVENLTTVPQHLDIERFRLDRTRAIQLQKEILAPRTESSDKKASKGFVYIVVGAKY